MTEVLRENWEFILYENQGMFILFVVNSRGNLTEVTYNLGSHDVFAFKHEGVRYLLEKARLIRGSAPLKPQLDF